MRVLVETIGVIIDAVRVLIENDNRDHESAFRLSESDLILRP